ncbi:MAG: hypothetical protein AB7E49_03090 [Campylobacterales bacterium]
MKLSDEKIIEFRLNYLKLISFSLIALIAGEFTLIVTKPTGHINILLLSSISFVFTLLCVLGAYETIVNSCYLHKRFLSSRKKYGKRFWVAGQIRRWGLPETPFAEMVLALLSALFGVVGLISLLLYGLALVYCPDGSQGQICNVVNWLAL